MKVLIPIICSLLLAGCAMRIPGMTNKTTGGGPYTTPHTAATEQAATQVFLQWSGIGLFAGGCLCLLAGILFGSYPEFATACKYARSGGATALVAGAIFLFTAAYVHALYWMVGLVVAGAIACGILWIVVHRGDFVPYFGRAKAKAFNNVGN